MIIFGKEVVMSTAELIRQKVDELPAGATVLTPAAILSIAERSTVDGTSSLVRAGLLTKPSRGVFLHVLKSPNLDLFPLSLWK